MKENMSSNNEPWPVVVGEKIRRQKLHALVGGAQQWGITSCKKGTAVLVFSNPLKSRKFGYDRWEGPRSDGAYHYTGQGPAGDQDVSARANKVLLRSKSLEIPVHLFEAEGPEVTYLGQFELAEDPYRYEKAPDINGLLRKVVVFQLIRVEIDHS